MKTPFKILFKEELSNVSHLKVLENFRANFTKTYCDHLKINGDKELVVTNDLLRWKPDLNLNLWAGIKTAKVTINTNFEKNTSLITYSVDFTRMSVAQILYLIFIPLIFKTTGFWDNQSLKYLIIFLILLVVLLHVTTFLRHWSIFKRTIKYGTEYHDNYDWKSIIKNKTDRELMEIINGKKQLPKTVIKLAELEIETRKNTN